MQLLKAITDKCTCITHVHVKNSEHEQTLVAACYSLCWLYVHIYVHNLTLQEATHSYHGFDRVTLAQTYILL